jgi:hypothetical protein
MDAAVGIDREFLVADHSRVEVSTNDMAHHPGSNAFHRVNLV